MVAAIQFSAAVFGVKKRAVAIARIPAWSYRLTDDEW